MQISTSARMGHGQGRAETTEVAAPAVRVRSGLIVKRGEYLGSKDKPFAFVWQDDEENVAPNREITVQAGRNGIWLYEGESPVVLADAFPGKREAARLIRAFEDWQRYFEKKYDKKQPQRFYWGRFNQEGRELARRLQAALIDEAIVRYKRPLEDPRSREADEIEL